MGGYAWVTLATNDAYSLGALVLAHSLRRVGTKYELAVLVTPGVTQMMREKLAAVFSLVQEVNVLDSKDEANLALLSRPELGITFTKLHCWRLTQYDKCVFVDADTLVVRNCDELFEREELSAAPDVGWPDCFNSGVFVYKPSLETFASITTFAAAKGSFDGGDQGLLNMYFNDWARKDISKHLPFIYNMCSTATYSYLPAFKQFGEDVRIIHFIGITKPWLQYFDTLTGIVQPPSGSTHLQPLLQLWWNIFCENVHPQLSPVMATSTLAPIWHEFPPTPFQSHVLKSPTYTDIIDDTQNDFFSQPPDFSEFKDPWENYSLQNDSVLCNTKANVQTEHCYCANNEIPSFESFSNNCNPINSMIQVHHGSLPAPDNQLYREVCHFPPTQFQNVHCEEEHRKHCKETEQQSTLYHTENKHTEDFSKQLQLNYVENQHRIEHSMHYNEQRQCSEHNTYCDQSHQNSNQLEQYHNQQTHQPVVHHHSHDHSSNDDCKSSWFERQDDNNTQVNSHRFSHQHSPQENQNHVVYHHEQRNGNNFHDNSNHLHEQINSQNAQETNFRHNEQTSVNIIIGHEQVAVNNRVYQNNQLNIQNKQQLESITIKNERTDIQNSTPSPSSKPCTDLHNVATQSDPNITEHLDNSNAGLAGALAQMTLGEPRSAEQIALEEHMRKQSWEQGQIDYMGRDSFDNIWKKICETIALAPPRLPSPPKEPAKSVERAEPVEPADPAEPAETAELTKPTVKDTVVESGVVEEVDKPTAAETTTSLVEEQTLINVIPVDKMLVQETSATNDTVPKQEEINLQSALTKQDEKHIDSVLTSVEKDMQQISVDTEKSRIEDTSQKPLIESEVSVTADAQQLPVCSLPKEVSEPMITPSSGMEKSSTEIPLEETLPEVVHDSANVAKSVPMTTVSTEGNIACPIKTDETVAESFDNRLVAQSDSKEEKQITDVLTTPIELPRGKDDSIPVVATELPSEEKTLQNLELDLTELAAKGSSIGSEQHAEILSAASEVLTVSPVPIQVAESVLQAEPKESISDDPPIVAQEVLSSTVTPVHEFTPAPSAVLPKPDGTIQLNGSASDVTPTQKNEKTTNVEPVSSISTSVTADVDNKPTEQPVSQVETAQVSSPGQTPTDPEKAPVLSLNIEKSVAQAEAPGTDENLQKLTETVQKVEGDKTAVQEIVEAATTLSQSEEIPTSPSTESPVRPTRAKELNIPSTPIVTEATPPTSPPITVPQDLESQEKVTKKTLKKTAEKTSTESESAEGGDGDSAEKKVVKKAVKKVVKKPKSKTEEAPDDGADSCSSPSKQKKTVKVVKKGTKPSQSLGADVPVPETPPPGTSDAPIPPKRKVKSTSSKPIAGKKSDVE